MAYFTGERQSSIPYVANHGLLNNLILINTVCVRDTLFAITQNLTV